MKQKIRRIISCCLLISQLFSIAAYAKPNWPSDIGVQAESGIVMDADSGAVMFAQNSHIPYVPASITKLLTALIVLEHSSLDDTVTFSNNAMYSVEADSGNKLSLAVGDQMSVEDCLYSLLLISVNQCANALAEHVAGSIPAFVDMMNAKLAELGCTESHFDNPSGLNGDTQYVTARDMALIAQAAFKNEKLLEISSSHTHKIAPTSNNPDGVSFANEHRLVVTDDPSSPYYYPDAVAGKTGYLLKAGNTLVTYAERGGRRLVSVILKGSPGQYFIDGRELLEFGFTRFRNITVADAEERYVTGGESLDLNGTSYKCSDLRIDPDAVITLPLDASISDADVSLGQLPENAPENAVALLTYTYNDRMVGRACLLYGDTPLSPSGTKNGDVTDNPDGSAAAVTGSDGESGVTGTDMKASPSQAGSGQSGRPSWNPASIVNALTIIMIVLVIALTAGLIIWIVRSRKKEAEELARRRERRRQRLKAEGAETEAEFERLLEERKNRDKH